MKVSKRLLSGFLVLVMMFVCWMPDSKVKAEVQGETDQVITDGTYDIPFKWYEMREDFPQQYNEAIGVANLIVKNGKGTLKLLLKSFYEDGLDLHMSVIRRINAEDTEPGTNIPNQFTTTEADVLETYPIEEARDYFNYEGSTSAEKGKEYPKVVSMDIPLGEDTIWIQAYAPIMGYYHKTTPVSRLVLDYSKIKSIPDEVAKLDAAVAKANAVIANNEKDKTDYSQETIAELKQAVLAASVTKLGTVLSVSQMENAIQLITSKMNDLKEVTYQITYVLYDGTNSNANPTTFTKSSNIKLQNPTKAERIFGGWVQKLPSGEKKVITAIEPGTEGDLTLYARWNTISVKTTSITSLTSSTKKQITAVWKAVSGADGYEITYSAKKDFSSKKIVRKSATKATLSTSYSGKVYYVKVKAYKLDSTGQRVYGKDSVVKSIKVK